MRLLVAFLVQALLLLAVWHLVGRIASHPKPDPLTAILVDRAVDFSTDDERHGSQRQVQSWTADGQTVLRNMGPSGNDLFGRWVVRSLHYCQMVGAQTNWTCMYVSLSDEGQTIHFSEDSEDVSDYVINPPKIDRTGHFLP